MKFVQVFLIFALVAACWAFSPDCPSFQQVTACSPKCKDDSECVAQGGKCCPNLCNQKSCVNKQNFNKVSDNKYGSSGGSGNYCGNVKCNAFEKCDTDKATKRPKCVRA